MDEFREFVKRYPKLRDDVRTGKRTWQNIYEEWSILGEKDNQWADYREENKQNRSANNTNNNQNVPLNESIKNIIGYIQKLNPDSINRTLNSIQKVIQIAQSFGPKNTNRVPYYTTPYSDWWD